MNKSHPSLAFERAVELATTGTGNALLLMEDGVYHAVEAQSSTDRLRLAITKAVQVYALSADVDARGLAKRVMPELQLLSDAKWVQLVAEQEQTVAWF